MAVEGSTSSAPEALVTRSRRALLAAGLGSLVAAAAAALGRPLPARAGTDGDVVLGAVNYATATTVVNNSASAASARALQGQITAATPGTNSAGVMGVNQGSNGNTHGVHGVHSGAGRGMFGQSASGYGVMGISTSGHGILGQTSATNRMGLYGYSPYRGVLGQSYAGGTNSAGVWGSSTSSEGTGVLGSADIGISPVGVRGTSTTGTGVVGNGGPAGFGVRGDAPSGVGAYGTGNDGVWGQGTNTGVFGWGSSYGVYGTSSAFDATGVRGDASTGTNAAGVRGTSTSGTGVLGNGETGVWGQGTSNGVYGSSSSGTAGSFLTTNPYGVGVQAQATSGAEGIGVWAISPTDPDSGASIGWAGSFNGNVRVFGTITEVASATTIDHPVDPANKTLSHPSVGSPDMKNIYDGTVTTDGNGRATVRLPAYFEALNRDFRYQLTVLGDFAQAVVAREIRDNRFTIRTDRPNVTVCWQVTGIRKDAYARAHPIKAEARKPARWRGRYLSPVENGQPASAGVDAERLARLRQLQPKATDAEQPRRTLPEPRPLTTPDTELPPLDAD